MPLILIYLLKLSVSLAAVYLFYQLVLRRLTFHNWNRWYLLGYTLLSFVVPFINITPALERSQLTDSGVINWIPVFHQSSQNTETILLADKKGITPFQVVIIILLAGMVVMMLRLIVQFISFRNMRQRAVYLYGDKMKVYEVSGNIVPFSFGKSVFINPGLHTEEELKEIIRHEFVHIRQRHSIDIIWSEMLCLVNWFNPFAWLLKKAIRQNLEFIADNKVLDSGINKKEYQYLLLKVTGNNQYSIATPFNFSSLKKRIAMMNKLKSAKVNSLRFLFILPVLAVIILSFRRELKNIGVGRQNPAERTIIASSDTLPDTKGPVYLNKKGYNISITDTKGNCTVVVKDKNNKEVQRLLLTQWNDNATYYENLFGELAPPPPPMPPGGNGMKEFLTRNPSVKEAGWIFNNDNTVVILQLSKKDGTSEKYNLENGTERKAAEDKYGRLPAIPPPSPVASPHPPAPADLPDHIQSININNGKATVTLKDGSTESYDLRKADEKKEFEKRYGGPPATPAAPAAPRLAISKMIGVDNLEKLCEEFEITDKKATMHLKTGETEEYDLTNIDQRRKFEKKYGRIINLPEEGKGAIAPVAFINKDGAQTVIAPMSLAARESHLLAVDGRSNIITGDEDVLVTITPRTTRQQLGQYKQQMKDKGIELTYDEIQYDDKGLLVLLSGRMKSKDGQSIFNAFDFGKLVLAMVRDGERTWFKVSTTEKKQTI